MARVGGGGEPPMRIRLTGTRDELTAAVAALAEVVGLREVSDFYPNRGASVLGRVYIEADLPDPHRPVPAHAERTDQPTRPGSRALTPRRATP